MREDGRRGCIDGEAANCTVFDTFQKFDKALEIHRFLQNVLHHFVHERVIRDLDIANNSLEAGRSLRENGSHEIFRTRALDLRGDPLALRETKELQATA